VAGTAFNELARARSPTSDFYLSYLLEIISMLENPNYTQIPNIILDSLDQLKPACLKVILAIARETLGWHQRSKTMSITFLMKKTGLSNRAVIDAGAELTDFGWVKRHKVKHERGETYEYELLLEPITAPVKKVHGLNEPTREKSSQVTREKSSQVTREKSSREGVKKVHGSPVKKVHRSKERSFKEKTKEKEPEFFSCAKHGEESSSTGFASCEPSNLTPGKEGITIKKDPSPQPLSPKAYFPIAQHRGVGEDGKLVPWKTGYGRNDWNLEVLNRWIETYYPTLSESKKEPICSLARAKTWFRAATIGSDRFDAAMDWWESEFSVNANSGSDAPMVDISPIKDKNVIDSEMCRQLVTRLEETGKHCKVLRFWARPDGIFATVDVEGDTKNLRCA
jgi:hypothetical protein